MKLKHTFVISEVAGQKVAVPIDCGYGEQNIIKINDTGAYILELLKNDISRDQIIADIKQNFTVESDIELEKWVSNFLQKLKEAEVLEND